MDRVRLRSLAGEFEAATGGMYAQLPFLPRSKVTTAYYFEVMYADVRPVEREGSGRRLGTTTASRFGGHLSRCSGRSIGAHFAHCERCQYGDDGEEPRVTVLQSKTVFSFDGHQPM